jgi:hypothetical protein
MDISPNGLKENRIEIPAPAQIQQPATLDKSHHGGNP